MKNTEASQLIRVLLQAKSEAAMLDLLEGLLTPSELTEIARRLQIVKLLKAGVSQREIAEKLAVGIATVTRGSREIKQGRFANL